MCSVCMKISHITKTYSRGIGKAAASPNFRGLLYYREILKFWYEKGNKISASPKKNSFRGPCFQYQILERHDTTVGNRMKIYFINIPFNG